VEYRLSNASIRIHLPVVQNVTLDVWVDANTDAVRVASSSDAPHKLEATLQIWRNTTGPYPWQSPGWACGNEGEVFISHPDTIEWQEDIGAGGSSDAGSTGSGLFFYHRNLAEWTTPLWQADLKSQQMPLGGALAVSPLTNITFGGYLSGAGAGAPAMIKTGPMQMVSASASATQAISIAGIADVYADVASFKTDLMAAQANAPSPSQHNATWAAFWANADINITGSSSPANPDVAAEAKRVTLLDRVNRAAFHSMAAGKHAIKFNGYGIWAAYPPGREDYRVWGWAQWFQNIRLPYVTLLALALVLALEYYRTFTHNIRLQPN
jgi:hypothetical protein